FNGLRLVRKSLKKIENRLTNDPVLTLPEVIEGFVMYCNLSRAGLDCVLMQNSKLIAYASTKLKTHKKNYPTHNLELTIVVFSSKI
ncbi:hypothetical protein MTR67_040010, partial [Solanum verrucosum]